jgi:hypothetical protein
VPGVLLGLPIPGAPGDEGERRVRVRVRTQFCQARVCFL